MKNVNIQCGISRKRVKMVEKETINQVTDILIAWTMACFGLTIVLIIFY